MATIGKVGHWKCVKIALPVHPAGLAVAVGASRVATELVEVSAAVADMPGVVDTVVAMVGEEVTAEEGLAEEPVAAMTLLVHPRPRIRSRIMPVLEANAAPSSMFAT